MEEISQFLNLTPEKRKQRKREWIERQKLIEDGKNPDKIKANDRAMKALRLLKDHVEGTIKLDEVTKVTLCGIVAERSIDSFYFFAKFVLDMDLLTDQTHKRWCDDHQKAIKSGKKRVMRLKPRALYKCLKKGTELINYGIDNKFNLTPVELFNQGDFYAPGLKVTTASGREHICTKDHLFKTVDGWSQAKPGLRIALNRSLPNPYKPIEEGQEYLVGLLVGDGCLRESTPSLSCADESIINRVKGYGFELRKTKGDNCDWNVLKFYDKIRSCGLEGTNSWTKFIPKEYEGSHHFLRGLFDADGSVSVERQMVIFVTVSEKLANDVLRNLLYFGIVARKKHYKYPKSEKSPAIDCFHVCIFNGFLDKFYLHINFSCEGKRNKLKKCIEEHTSIKKKNPNVDSIPGDWKKFLKPNQKRQIRYELGLRIDNKHSHSREKVLACGEFVRNQEVIDIAKSNIFWDKIVSVEEIGEVEFSAIGSSNETYISSDGIVHHNTTVYGIAGILWLWGCINPQLRIFYTSSNALLLQEVADKLNQYIGSEKSETLYSMIFGITKDGTAKNTSDVMNITGRSGKGFSLILRTSGGSSVGIHPNIIIVDDPCDQKDRDSQATRDEKERWFDTLTPLIVPFKDEKTGIEFQSIYYIGTRWHMRDLVWHILEVNKKLPEHHRWDIEIESIYNEEGKSNYPEIMSEEKIQEIRAGISDVFFACQYENNPLPEGLQIFDMKRLVFIREDQVDIRQGQMICCFDPSLGKSHSDYPIVFWLHKHDDLITVYDCIDKKVELSLIVHQIASKNQEYGVRFMRYESNGISLLDQSLKDAHLRIGHRIQLDPVHHTQNKDERILSIQPELYSGRVRFMADYLQRYPEAMNQILFYPVYGTDDAPDCLEVGLSYFRQAHFKFVRYEACL